LSVRVRNLQCVFRHSGVVIILPSPPIVYGALVVPPPPEDHGAVVTTPDAAMPSLPADARHSAAATQDAPDLIRLGIDGVLSGLLSVSSDPEKRAIRPRSAEHSHSRWPKTTSTPLKVGNLFCKGGASAQKDRGAPKRGARGRLLGPAAHGRLQTKAPSNVCMPLFAARVRPAYGHYVCYGSLRC
jgi:hypothetical protein